jgi:hypothetical protein
MPTKTNKSPLTLPPALIGTAVKGAAGALSGGIGAGLGELKQIREEFKEQDFKEQKFGKKLGMLAKAGLRGFGAYQRGMLSGASKALLGTDFGLGQSGVLADNQSEAEQIEEQPTYTTNIDPMTGEEIPLMMTGNMKPLKMLTGVKGNIPHNMSAKQYNDALKMQEISGAAPLQSNAFYASLNAAKEEGRDTFEVGGKTFNVK